MQNNRVELLAPAGNMEGFYGAIHAGADAVYLGGSRFSARAYADNFTTEELVSCIRYAHIWGRKVYLTINTLVKETELRDIYAYLLPFYEAGLDGVIIQDIGVLTYIREHFQDMELHISTQMTLTGEYGAKLLKDMGACRIVPARELSLQEVSHIKEQTGLSIECFIHGAMCYCYSGQCLFSSILGGRSGNRGRCAQPCRLPYTVTTDGRKSQECYPLSLKDMCTIEHIPALIQSGIDSFKIEGRMKKPEYTAGVTAIYRKYIDKYYQTFNSVSAQKMKIDAADLKELSCLYIRSERQDGYYYRHNGKDMVTLSSPAYSGSDETILTQIRTKYLAEKPKRAIRIFADFTTGQKAMVTFMVDDEAKATVQGERVQVASKQPISAENIVKQLSKLGDSSFALKNIDVNVSEDAFYPLRDINELRRQAIRCLENALMTQNGFPLQRRTPDKDDSFLPDRTFPENVPYESASGELHLSIRRQEQLESICRVLSSGKKYSVIRRIYINCDLFADKNTGELIRKCSRLAERCELVIAMPYIIRKKDIPFIENRVFALFKKYPDIFSGVLVRSMEGIGMAFAQKDIGRIYTDAGFYIWNRQTLQEWSGKISGFCMPYELKGAEQRKLLGEIPCEKIIYGRIPMMITANCITKTTAECKNGTENAMAILTDRYHKNFPVELNCIHCMNIIYNSVPLSLHGELSKWKNMTHLRLDFTVETDTEVEEILAYFTQIVHDGSTNVCAPPFKNYTTGHERRGVE